MRNETEENCDKQKLISELYEVGSLVHSTVSDILYREDNEAKILWFFTGILLSLSHFHKYGHINEKLRDKLYWIPRKTRI